MFMLNCGCGGRISHEATVLCYMLYSMVFDDGVSETKDLQEHKRISNAIYGHLFLSICSNITVSQLVLLSK